MRKLKHLLLLAMVFTLGMAGCKKNGPDEDGPKPDTEAQTQAKEKIMGKWTITGAVFIKTLNGELQAPAVYDFTDEDYYFDFKSDKDVFLSYITRNGDYTFKFSEDGKVFTASQTGTSSIDYEVKQNTATDLVLFTTHVLSNGTETEEIFLKKTP